LGCRHPFALTWPLLPFYPQEPAARLATLEAAGLEGVPFTTGLLVGIGETRAERVAALLAVRSAHRRHGHVQARPRLGGRGVAARDAPPATDERRPIPILPTFPSGCCCPRQQMTSQKTCPEDKLAKTCQDY
jgi:hypothetical protein